MIAIERVTVNNQNHMKLSLINVYQDDAMLRRAFSWLARVGAGPKFGSRPIGWYQMHMCAAIDELLRLNIWNPVCKDGMITERGQHGKYIFARDLYSISDRKIRSA